MGDHGFATYGIREGGEMKLLRVVLGCLLVAALCVPSIAGAEQKFSLGVQFDTSQRDYKYSDLDSVNANAQAWRHGADVDTDYSFTNHILGVVGRWQPCDFFAAEGMIGFSDMTYKQAYMGGDADQSSVFISSDYSTDPFYGLKLDFFYPINDVWTAGVVTSGRFGFYKGADVTTGDGMFSGVTQMDVQWWDVNVFGKAVYNGFKNVKIYAGPTFSLARLEIQKKVAEEEGVVEDKLTLDEEDLWGIRGGFNLRLTDKLNATLEGKLINETGATAGLSYQF